MDLTIKSERTYRLPEDSRIETGNGALYKAQDLTLGRTVAVKQVRIQGNNRFEKKQNVQKALSEVQALVAVRDTDVRVPAVFDTYYDEPAGELFIVMEWVSGTPLTDKMNASAPQFLRWMADLCFILERMERKRLYHKDIKPANVMISRTGQLYLIDFNITIAAANLVEGTPHYKAPEMSPGSIYSGREKVDMFAIGVMLYEYFTGAVPVRTVDYARNRQRGPQQWDLFVQPKEKNPATPDKVNEIVVKCMKLDPKDRYGSISQLKQALKEAGDELRGRPKRIDP